MNSFTDYLTALFISDDDVQTHVDVAAAQQAALDRQRAEEKIGWYKYFTMSGEVQDAGNDLGDYKRANSSLLATVPIVVWLALAAVVFWYLGGFIWLKGILARNR